MPAGRPRQKELPPVPHKLRELRSARRIPQETVAEKLNTTAQTVQRVETGETEMRVRDLGSYADAIGVQPAELLGYQNIFTDPSQARLNEIYSRLTVEDRGKLVRMALALEPFPSDVVLDGMTADQVIEAAVKKGLADHAADLAPDAKERLAEAGRTYGKKVIKGEE